MTSRPILALELGAAVAASTARASEQLCAEELANGMGEPFGANRTGTLLFVDHSAKRVSTVFDIQEFNLAAVRRGARVPRVFLAALPQDISRLRAVQDKRSTFIPITLCITGGVQ